MAPHSLAAEQAIPSEFTIENAFPIYEKNNEWIEYCELSHNIRAERDRSHLIQLLVDLSKK
jgi:hypothetical protein